MEVQICLSKSKKNVSCSEHSGAKSEDSSEQATSKAGHGTEDNGAVDGPVDSLTCLDKGHDVSSVTGNPTNVTDSNVALVVLAQLGWHEAVGGEPVGGSSVDQTGLVKRPASEHGVTVTAVEGLSGSQVGGSS